MKGPWWVNERREMAEIAIIRKARHLAASKKGGATMAARAKPKAQRKQEAEEIAAYLKRVQS